MSQPLAGQPLAWSHDHPVGAEVTAEHAGGGTGVGAGDPGAGAEALTERLEAISARMTDSHQRMVHLLDGAIAQMSAQPTAPSAPALAGEGPSAPGSQIEPPTEAVTPRFPIESPDHGAEVPPRPWPDEAAAVEDHTASAAALGPAELEVPLGDAEAVATGPTEAVATEAAGTRPVWKSNLIVGLLALVVLLLAVEIVNVV